MKYCDMKIWKYGRDTETYVKLRLRLATALQLAISNSRVFLDPLFPLRVRSNKSLPF